MSGVAIYMEGGGDGRDTKTDLRQGMDTLLQPLKEAARPVSCIRCRPIRIHCAKYGVFWPKQGVAQIHCQ